MATTCAPKFAHVSFRVRYAGSGYLFETDELGYRKATTCVCRKLERKVGFFNDALIPGRYASATFGRIDVAGHASDMKVARSQAWRDLFVNTSLVCRTFVSWTDGYRQDALEYRHSALSYLGSWRACGFREFVHL